VKGPHVGPDGLVKLNGPSLTCAYKLKLEALLEIAGQLPVIVRLELLVHGVLGDHRTNLAGPRWRLNDIFHQRQHRLGLE